MNCFMVNNLRVVFKPFRFQQYKRKYGHASCRKFFNDDDWHPHSLSMVILGNGGNCNAFGFNL